MKHLFFDLDNTLWDFDKNTETVLNKLFYQYKLEPNLNANFDSFYKVYLKNNELLWHLYGFRKISKDELRFKRFFDTFFDFGINDSALAQSFSDLYIQQAPQGTLLKPHCIETLNELMKKFELHIITNGFTQSQTIKLSNCGLMPYFKHIIISEETGYNKPELEIFNLARNMAKANPKNCVMIGDDLINDVQGALNAGWQAVHFCEHSAKKESGYISITALPELLKMF